MAIRHVAAAVMMLALVAIGASNRTAAQTAPSVEALQAAQELTSLMNVSATAELLKNINDKVWPNLEAAIRRQHTTIDGATVGELRQEFERLQMASVQDSIRDAALIYARLLTIDEMRAMIAFYRSPAGAKSLAIMPTVQAELVKAMAPRLQGLQAKLTLAYLDILQRRGLSPR